MSPEMFHRKYCKEKPFTKDHIVFLCRRGERSYRAMNQARKLGYENSSSYQGGFLNWFNNERIIREKRSRDTSSRRFIHTSGFQTREIKHKEFLELQKNGLTVIDVREDIEIKSSGTIPGSLNIPVKQIASALSKTPKDFKAKFGINKPNEKRPIMFLCRKGQRSRTAMEQALQLGYKQKISQQGQLNG